MNVGAVSGSVVLEILLGCVTVAALIRSAWLLVGLARVIPVHRRARITRWGLAEELTFLELASEFGVAFEAYCRCVGRLLPRLR
jgi:protein-S-isoprenylcysteine O-methyltransferase Ste14